MNHTLSRHINRIGSARLARTGSLALSDRRRVLPVRASRASRAERAERAEPSQLHFPHCNARALPAGAGQTILILRMKKIRGFKYFERLVYRDEPTATHGGTPTATLTAGSNPWLRATTLTATTLTARGTGSVGDGEKVSWQTVRGAQVGGSFRREEQERRRRRRQPRAGRENQPASASWS